MSEKKHNKFNLSLGFIIGIVFFGFFGATISFPFANTIVHERLKMTTTTLAPVIYCISPIILLLKLIFADEEQENKFKKIIISLIVALNDRVANQ